MTSRLWQATEEDGWDMSVVHAKAMNAISAYRTLSDNGYTYTIVTSAKCLNDGEPPLLTA